jgi:hypothetical protein
MDSAVGCSVPCHDLHFDALVHRTRHRFETIPDPRRKPRFSLPDTLLAALAMFALKDSSLLAFQRRTLDDNLRRVFGLTTLPRDAQMRAILDDVDPDHVRPVFRDVFARLRDARVLDAYRVEGCFLVALDGVEYFRSQKVHCPQCMSCQHTNGTVSYYHQLLAAAIVHPDFSEVIPLAPEPIQRVDGETKNDCERNAAGRWLERFRQDHPDVPVLVIEDGLSSNAPHVRDLLKAKCHFLLIAKPTDHAYLFEHVCRRQEKHEFDVLEEVEARTGIVRSYLWITDVPLNGSNADVKVTFLHLLETRPDGTHGEWTWVTDRTVHAGNVGQLARAGRARWRIENETFNVLKNQGYHFEHNFGHGEKNLSVVLAHLMLVAFLFDQGQQRCNPLFQAALAKKGVRTALWEHVRHLFASFEVASMGDVYRAMAVGFRRPQLSDLIATEPGQQPPNDSS